MKRLTLLLLAFGLAAALVAIPATAGGGTKTWRVTIENLTTGQPLSPPLLVVHSTEADVWTNGTIASHGVAAIAEDANNAVLESALPQIAGVMSAETGAGGPIGPGGTAVYEVESQGAYNRLSILTMLVNTNDAFTGLDSLHLRGSGKTVLRMAYDAGSERNNELASHIPGPAGGNPFVRDPRAA